MSDKVYVAKNGLSFPTRARPWLFLWLALGLTWVFGFTAVLLQNSLPQTLFLPLAYGGSLAPILVAVGLAYKHGRSYWRDFWQRIIDYRRISWRWVGVILLFFPAKSVLAALVDGVQGGWGMAPEGISRLLAQPLLIVPTLLFWLFFGPIPEEPGWRGYAVDGLQSHHGAVASSLIVGVVWMLWHLPLFFIAGTWQESYLGFGTLLFWLWVANVVMESVLYTWIYNNTGRSTLAAILFHFAGNAFGELFALSAQAEIYSTVLSVTAVILVIIIWGPRTLTARKTPQRQPF